MNKITFGVTAKDLITGFQGIVIALAVHSNNCDRVAIQMPGVQEDGNLKASIWFDAPQLKLVDSEVTIPIIDAGIPKFNLLDKVKHKYTGFEGTVTTIGTWVNGCHRFGVQGSAIVKGIPTSDEWFAQNDLELIKMSEPAPPIKTGGPMSAPKKASCPR